MSRKCSVCTHGELAAIDAALVAGKLSMRDIALRFSVGHMSLFRHRNKHLPTKLVLAEGAREAADATGLVAQMVVLQRRTLALLSKAERKGQTRIALAAIAQARNNLALLGKLSGELAVEGAVNIVLAPEWLALRVALVGALAPFPDARRAVVAVLATSDEG